MNAYLGIKFHEDLSNKEFIESLADSIEKAGIRVVVFHRDFEKWGEISFKPEELMKKTFEFIKKSDLLIIEFSEKGVGLSIEAGFAYANNIPIWIIAKKSSKISETIKGIAKEIILYDNFNDLTLKLEKLISKKKDL